MAANKRAAAPAAAAPAFALEPGLPWISMALRTAGPDAFAAFLADKLLLDFQTNQMAPHFPAGCLVLAEQVTNPADVIPGVYAVLYAGQLVALGRLAAEGIRTRPFALHMTLDNGPALAPVVLDWQDTQLQVWRVVYYASYPAE
ncbi:hypothetical protein [Hymenobacter metallicola]|uniref:Uncharacterized protein n=1 Tax=Hymenobacter metallicola TaxID=2563114 RepID=A0A4Z0Q207_9BACT|nr:hypothetical protein [Hymenobacter metallicola]TGE23529.1 hypothetical protein E5K02_20300 [Hymenobacter metallicola]